MKAVMANAPEHWIRRRWNACRREWQTRDSRNRMWRHASAAAM